MPFLIICSVSTITSLVSGYASKKSSSWEMRSSLTLPAALPMWSLGLASSVSFQSLCCTLSGVSFRESTERRREASEGPRRAAPC